MSHPHCSTGQCISLIRVHCFSSVLDQIDVPFIGKQLEGDLFPSVNPLVGWHEPGPTTGDIWAKYEVKPFLVITREQVLAVGKDPDSLSKYPNELSGLAEEAYMAGLDIFYSVPAPLLQHYPAGGF